MYFDGNGDPAATYELVNWQRNQPGDIVFVTVGSYDASLPKGKQFTMNGINITWAAESQKVSNMLEYYTRKNVGVCGYSTRSFLKCILEYLSKSKANLSKYYFG